MRAGERGAMSEQDLVGRTIKDRYILLKPIGAGGMATVYEATDRKLNKRVAVKVLNEEWRSNLDMINRFRWEPWAAARVEHPHLVNVTETGETDDYIPFFVMEYLDGRTLAQELDECGAMPWRRVVRLAVQICSALTALHERGIIHRDIKPSNCLLLRGVEPDEDFVKVLDLGIAKATEAMPGRAAWPQTRTDESAPITPEYASPEQAGLGPIGVHSDLYSLGVVMYQLLAGQRPFTRSDNEPPWRLLEKHCEEPPPRLRAVAPNADIPVSIEQIVMRCLAKTPAERWASAAELAAALREAERKEQRVKSSDTWTRTACYHPPEPPYALPRVLHRGLMVMLGFLMFSLSFMTLVLVDLPGVTPLASLFAAEPPARPRPRKVVLMVPDSDDAERAPSEPTPAQAPPPAPKAPPAAAGPAPPTTPAPEPAAAKPVVARAAAKPRPKPSSPQALVDAFIGKQKRTLKTCGEKLPRAKTFPLKVLVTAQGTITAVSVVSESNTPVGVCVFEVLKKLKGSRIPGVTVPGVYNSGVRLP